MNTCIKCGQQKPVDAFHWHKKRNRPYPDCKDCRHAYASQYYQANKRRLIEKAATRNAAAKTESVEWLREYFKTHPCVDCGASDIRVLDFDHVRGIKRAPVVLLLKFSLDVVKEEVKKCEVRCKNCHAIVTYERMGGSWRDSLQLNG